jgi:hypothetical protein
VQYVALQLDRALGLLGFDRRLGCGTALLQFDLGVVHLL